LAQNIFIARLNHVPSFLFPLERFRQNWTETLTA